MSYLKFLHLATCLTWSVIKLKQFSFYRSSYLILSDIIHSYPPKNIKGKERGEKISKKDFKCLKLNGQ
jgi:hypothetical protein